jgi:ribosomal protein S11
MKKIMLFVGFSILASALFAQTDSQGNTSVWKTLGKITFKKEYDEMMGFKVDVPVFSQEVQALAGKEVIVKGYIIPVEDYGGQLEFVFSAFPYNMCFFCGGAGPETVMKVSAIEEIPYTAEAISIKGKLVLNSTDRNELMYALTDVVKVE